MMNATLTLSHETGKRKACETFQVPRSSFYRHTGKSNQPAESCSSKPAPPLALRFEEKSDVLNLLYSGRFQDKAPHQVYAALLDEGDYYCSIRTMYRLLADDMGDVKERRRQYK
jgi:putative transposase